MPFFDDNTDLPEIPLTGGRITGGVVRVGDTVRRPRTEASGFVVELLGVLAGKGFQGAPEYLGIDAKGRDCFSHVEGEVAAKWRHWPDEVVVAFGKLFRAFHDATRGTPLAGEAPVVCHHDAGPHNTILRDGMPVALIDFDMAAPGEVIEDVAYAAWAWCISSNPARPGVEHQAAQVRLLAEACGLDADERKALPAAIIARMENNVTFWEDRGRRDEAAEETCAMMIGWTRREREFVSENLKVFGEKVF